MRYLPLISLAILSLMLAHLLGNNISIPVKSLMIGKTLPEIALPVLGDDRTIPISTQIGFDDAPVLINFFASWCLPCQQEMPVLANLAREKKIRMIGIAWRNKQQDAAKWLDTQGNPYEAVFIDKDGKSTVPFALTGVPESFIVQGGNIVFHSKSVLTEEEVAPYLKVKAAP